MFSFIETRLFSRLVQDYLSDEDYCKLQGELQNRLSSKWHWRRQEASMGSIRTRETCRVSRHLLCAPPSEHLLDAYDLPKERD